MKKLLILFTIVLLANPVFAQSSNKPAQAPDATSAVDQVDAIADELLEFVRERYPYIRLMSGLPVTDLYDITYEEAQEEAQFNQQMLAKLHKIPLDELPHEKWLLARMLQHKLRSGIHNDQDYWLRFVVTPYAGGSHIQGVHRIFRSQQFQEAEDLNSYLHLLDEYVIMLDQIAAKTLEQAERGIRVAKPAIPGVLQTFKKLKASAPHVLKVSAQRFGKELSPALIAAFQDDASRRIKDRIIPAYDRIIAIFDEAYRMKAPDQVGISQYPGGKEYYKRLIINYTGLTLTPKEIHERGLSAVAKLEQQMRAIREEVGFNGTREEFREWMNNNPRFFEKTPAEVEERYRNYIARIEPYISTYFSTLPRAPYDVKRLDPAAEAGMTYGYYQPPTPADSIGYYRYNGSNLDDRSFLVSAHILYHELIPGHHFHVALQRERKGVHPLREFLFYGAFNEGWAEYAAELANEMGAFRTPYERYGHLASQAFLAVRLVVDTGMNYFGWPLEKARQYMREHTMEAKSQISTETLRYSTDIFAQAVGYRLGYEKIMELRKRAKRALGSNFDIREFHTAIIGSGAMPLNVLDEHIDWFIKQQISN